MGRGVCSGPEPHATRRAARAHVLHQLLRLTQRLVASRRSALRVIAHLPRLDSRKRAQLTSAPFSCPGAGAALPESCRGERWNLYPPVGRRPDPDRRAALIHGPRRGRQAAHGLSARLDDEPHL
eukprot:6384398-Prymnesium_polylepis.2